jgi:small conductance mechanosensitive channel
MTCSSGLSCQFCLMSISAVFQLGVVKEISIFTTHLLSPENKFIIVPNSLATADNIVNFSKEGKIRADVNV